MADEIAEYAASVGADMVLMTTHGHTGVSRMWLGSVADALIRQTTLPILVVHPGEQGNVPRDVLSFKHILVPLDGSDLSASILGPATEVARATGARLTLLHVVSSTAVLGARIFPLMPDDITPAMEKARRSTWKAWPTSSASRAWTWTCTSTSTRPRLERSAPWARALGPTSSRWPPTATAG